MVQIVGKECGDIGFGLMGFTWRSNPTPHEKAIPVMKEALNRGANFWNGGDFYGPPEANSLQLLKAYFEKYPEDADKVILSMKTGLPGLDGSEQGMRGYLQKNLDLLQGIKKIDIFELCRVSPSVPIEETIKALADFQKDGKIGGIGLSEVNGNTVRRAAKVAPIAAVEIELSLWQTHTLENGTAQACKDLDIPIIAYSPLGRGFLTGQIKKPEDIADDDLRKKVPRFQGENFHKNIKLVDELKSIAEKKGCTPAQLAIGWVSALNGKWGPVLPIPGATTTERVQENMTVVKLTSEDLDQIRAALTKMPPSGERHPESMARLADQ